MGIRNLTKFVDSDYKRWERDRRVRGTLVVDGNCILHSLHTMEWSNGGQYREFRNAVRRFYSKLLESGISPIVVFDGVDEAHKWDTLVRRKRERVSTIRIGLSNVASGKAVCDNESILPPLIGEVYRMALYGLDIQFYVADAEADAAIARLANHYHCPVLSQDSDFFVFRLVGGFIHFKHFHWDSSVVTADVYHRDQFADQLGLRDRSLFCMIPAIVGNDFMKPCTTFISQMVHSMSSTGSAGFDIRAICSHLSHFSSVQQFNDLSYGGKRLQQQCKEALKLYEVRKTLSCEELVSSTKLKHRNGTKFPEWLIRLFHLGRLPSSCMNAAFSLKAILHVAADNFNKESSLMAAKPIRQHIYALLDINSVVEFIRSGLTIKEVKVTRKDLNGDDRGLTFSSIELLSHKKRQHLFYEILECDNLNINQKLNETNRYQDWRFVAATVSFWARSTRPPEHLVRALLHCITLCSLPDEQFCFESMKVPLEFRQSQEWLDTLHCFSQWQAIYHTAWTLNALLNEPMWVFSPAFLYDGQLAMHLASSQDDYFLQQYEDPMLYNSLEEIVFGVQPTPASSDISNTGKASNLESSESMPLCSNTAIDSKNAADSDVLLPHTSVSYATAASSNGAVQAITVTSEATNRMKCSIQKTAQREQSPCKGMLPQQGANSKYTKRTNYHSPASHLDETVGKSPDNAAVGFKKRPEHEMQRQVRTQIQRKKLTSVNESSSRIPRSTPHQTGVTTHTQYTALIQPGVSHKTTRAPSQNVHIAQPNQKAPVVAHAHKPRAPSHNPKTAVVAQPNQKAPVVGHAHKSRAPSHNPKTAVVAQPDQKAPVVGHGHKPRAPSHNPKNAVVAQPDQKASVVGHAHKPRAPSQYANTTVVQPTQIGSLLASVVGETDQNSKTTAIPQPDDASVRVRVSVATKKPNKRQNRRRANKTENPTVEIPPVASPSSAKMIADEPQHTQTSTKPSQQEGGSQSKTINISSQQMYCHVLSAQNQTSGATRTPGHCSKQNISQVNCDGTT